LIDVPTSRDTAEPSANKKIYAQKLFHNRTPEPPEEHNVLIINIAGLAIGFASAMLIGIWVYQEWNYDRHYEGADRIYRIGVNFMSVGDLAVGPVQFTDYAREFPEVESATRISRPSQVLFRIDDKQFSESEVIYTDSAFFRVFSHSFLEGNPANALNRPNSMVITRSVAQKFFRGSPALDQTILVGEEKEPYIVTGVVADPVYKSHINARIWIGREYDAGTNWLSASVYNYVKLKEDFDRASLDSRLYGFIESRISPTLPQNISVDYTFLPITITDIYLTSEARFEPSPTGSKSNITIFGAIAFLVLLIAAINFVNITTARSSTRAREVGIRKTLGSKREALVGQFLVESVMLSGIALLLSFGLAEGFLTLFEQVTGLKLVEKLITDRGILATVCLIALSTGLLAGVYPAFYLTAWKPVRVLKGNIFSPNGKIGFLRNGLIVVQFTISVCLIIGTAVIYKQLQYMQTSDLGFDKENVLVIGNTQPLEGQREFFKQALLEQAGVESASYTRVPAGGDIWVASLRTPEMDEGLPMQNFPGDHDMISTLGFRIVEGRDFSLEFASDTSTVILTQKAVQALGLTEPLGTILNGHLEVIGVAADFHFQGLKDELEPAALTLNPDGISLAIRFTGNPQPVIGRAQQLWDEVAGSSRVDYYFLDERFEALLEKEKLLSKAVLIFSVLAIIISCLGLYGLSAFMTERRTKEISIRRVLGASMRDIVLMLNKSFTKTVLIAIVVSVPVATIIMNRWLEDFAYRIEIGVWVYAAAGVLAMAIALLTVSTQAIRAALVNPVESLKYE
jgi:putative ABC transport system permease protein